MDKGIGISLMHTAYRLFMCEEPKIQYVHKQSRLVGS